MKNSFIDIALIKIKQEEPQTKVVIAGLYSNTPSVNLITENGNFVSLTPETAIEIAKNLIECAQMTNPKLPKTNTEGDENHGFSLN